MFYCSTLTLTATSYPTTPQVEIPFVPKSISIVVASDDITEIVTPSFDGANPALPLTPTINPGHRFDQNCKRVWLKIATGSASVHVYAEA